MQLELLRGGWSCWRSPEPRDEAAPSGSKQGEAPPWNGLALETELVLGQAELAARFRVPGNAS